MLQPFIMLICNQLPNGLLHSVTVSRQLISCPLCFHPTSGLGGDVKDALLPATLGKLLQSQSDGFKLPP